MAFWTSVWQLGSETNLEKRFQ